MRSSMFQPNRIPQLRICSLSIPALGERMDNLFSTSSVDSLGATCSADGRDSPTYIRCATPRPTEHPSCLFGFADLLGRLLCRLLRLLCNAEVFEFFTGFDCCREPARRQSASGPGFARIFWIAVFRGNRAAHAEPKPEPFGT